MSSKCHTSKLFSSHCLVYQRLQLFWQIPNARLGQNKKQNCFQGLNFQKLFVSFPNKNKCKTDIKCWASWLGNKENY